MMTLADIEQERAYLNRLRSFTQRDTPERKRIDNRVVKLRNRAAKLRKTDAN